ncbi:MAG: 2,4-dihydroxyhept-2-ene-1,7-dioic acid aldolase [Chloroflexi bacterium]|nr:MAG: 2,4-dihydroxyhept-2-ene-1,7-dioic acid aldolase [Chloroflexota bacterium]
MSQPFVNPLKQKLRQGKKTAGAWLQLGSPMTAEIMSRAGFDWLIVDMEHAPVDFMTLVSQMQAMASGGAVPLARAPWNDFVTIKRILDAGAYGVLVPYVNTRQEAEAAVKACKYPPQGIRGTAGSPRAAGYGQNAMNYLPHANEQILILTAVETAEAVNNLDDILAVPGLDGIFIGPMDLSTSMGHMGNPGHPDVQAAIETIERKTLAAGKILATIAGNWEQAAVRYAKGYQMIMLMADGVALGKMAGELAGKFREVFPGG